MTLFQPFFAPARLSRRRLGPALNREAAVLRDFRLTDIPGMPCFAVARLGQKNRLSCLEWNKWPFIKVKLDFQKIIKQFGTVLRNKVRFGTI
jgi:hypothetical protein